MRTVPIRVEALAPAQAGDPPSVDGAGEGACSGAESFALMVLGDAMTPEFENGDVIIVEPDGLAVDGSFVVAWWNGEWTFRQLARRGDGWWLHCLNPAHADVAIPDLQPVRGVVIQKSKPGRRRLAKRYVD